MSIKISDKDKKILEQNTYFGVSDQEINRLFTVVKNEINRLILASGLNNKDSFDSSKLDRAKQNMLFGKKVSKEDKEEFDLYQKFEKIEPSLSKLKEYADKLRGASKNKIDEELPKMPKKPAEEVSGPEL